MIVGSIDHSDAPGYVRFDVEFFRKSSDEDLEKKIQSIISELKELSIWFEQRGNKLHSKFMEEVYVVIDVLYEHLGQC